jgi:hypothetical protein
MHAKLHSWCTFRRTGKAECKDLNATRLNPTLSLAGSMRCIAGWSLDRSPEDGVVPGAEEQP